MSLSQEQLILTMLTKRLTVESARTRYAEFDRDIKAITGQSGGFVEHFEDTIQDMSEGDQIWLFDSPDKSWENMCGMRGLAVIRARVVIAFILETRN